MEKLYRIVISFILLLTVGTTVAPLELMGDGFVCIEGVQKTNGEEKDGGEENETFNDSGEISDAVISCNEVSLGHKLDSENAPWLNHYWENALSEILSPPPDSAS